MNQHPTENASILYETMLAEATRASATWQPPQPPFTYELGWASQYEQLFLDRYVERSPVHSVLEKATLSGRVLIAAKGGAAKSTIVRELFRHVIKTQEGLPLLVTMQAWRAPFYDKWKSLPEGWIARLNFILEELSVPKISTATLDAVSKNAVITLFVDGLNEVSSTVAQDLLAALDEFGSRTAQSRVIITDRLARRMLPSGTRWQLATILPLDAAQVRAHLLQHTGSDIVQTAASDADLQILRVPFFLNQRLHSAGRLGSRAATFEQYFASHVLRQEQLDVAGRAAFLMYREDRSRTFHISEFRAIAGEDITENLLQAGALEQSGELAYFQHHLQHDYLASRFIVGHDDQWDHTMLDRVTFGASSFDILSLCVEQLRTTREVDKFLTLTYDWNLYGTAYALADSYSSSAPVSREMHTVIVAMLADRKGDLILATVQRARDALALFPAESLARHLLSIDSREEVVRTIVAVQSRESWFLEWRSLFTIGDRSRVSSDVVSRVLDEHSIIGWTTANVLRRVILVDEQEELLRSWANEETRSPTVIWRIAHALGTHANEKNRDVLVKLLSSSHFWVRYGAMRSLIECAAYGSVRLRRSVFQQLRRILPSLPTRVLSELEEAVLIDPLRAPRDWQDMVTPLLRGLYSDAKSENERVRLQNVMQRLTADYAAI